MAKTNMTAIMFRAMNISSSAELRDQKDSHSADLSCNRFLVSMLRVSLIKRCRVKYPFIGNQVTFNSSSVWLGVGFL